MRASTIVQKSRSTFPTSSSLSSLTHRSRAFSMAPKKKTSTSNRNDTNISSSSVLLDAASSYLNNMKLKIASSLTSSMNEADRQELFTSLNVNVVNQHQQQSRGKEMKHDLKADEPKTLSINEAVAEAVAKEASKRDSLLEKERVGIFKQAEQAALERVQNDLVIQQRKLALQRWEQELKDEQEQQKQQQQQQHQPIENQQQQQQPADHHPILGKALIDFGYKRIHVMPTKNLASIPIWEKQRVYRHERAKIMAKDKLRSMDLGLPGVVALHENLDGELSIIDGQHRVGMLAILQAKASKNDHVDTHHSNNNKHLDLNNILVEVFPQTPTSLPTHAQDIFIEINKAEPVKLVDMPGVASSVDRRIINDTATYLEEQYPEMFKPSQRCRPPHLNIDNLRDAIFASGLLKKHKITSKTALLKWVTKHNGDMKKKFQKDETLVNNTALEKARKFDFYLGLDLTWLNQ